MSAKRNCRLPISCEPCRIRKIKCPRDATPCTTCVRRGVSPKLCRYARRTASTSDSGSAYHTTYVFPRSPESPSTNELAERVQRLEQLIQAQAAPDSTSVELLSRSRRTSYSPPGVTVTGTLRTTESGHVRYVPHALDFETRLTLSEHDTSKEGRVDVKSHPLDNIARTSLRDLLAALPPRSQCTELVHIYFTSFASLFHVLHDPTFHQQYSSFEQDPESTPLAWLALLFAVLSTAVCALPNDSLILHDLSHSSSAVSQVADLSERYRTLAMRCLEADHYLWDHNITTLQALLLLVYGIGHSHGQAWTLLGLSHHLALSIGAHVDPATLALDAVQCEERRRCWAGLKMLYTTQNTAMGHIGIPNAFLQSNCQPPADVDDKDLVPGQLGVIQTPPSGKATQMTYLLLKFRLYDLCTEICEKALQGSDAEEDIINEFDNRIQQEQSHFELKYFGHVQSEALPLHHLAHVHVLRSYSDHLILLLHHNKLPYAKLDEESNRRSRQRCLESANRLLESHKVLHESPEFAPFRWYNNGLGSFYAFHAAVVLIALCREDLTEVRVAVETCLARFKAMKNVSPLCNKAAPLLEYLLECITGDLPLVDGHAQGTETPWMTTRLQTPSSSLASGFDGTNNSDGIDWDSFWSEFHAQQWITPTYAPWDQWNNLINPQMLAATH